MRLQHQPFSKNRWPLAPLFFCYYVCIGMFLTIGITVGDTLFLTHSGPARISTLYAWTHVGVAFGAILLTWVYAQSLEKMPRPALIVGFQTLLAWSLVLFQQWLRAGHTPKTIWAYFGLLIWLKVCGQMLTMIFFSFAGDYFTTRQARRVYGYLAGGLAVGTIAGGWLMKPLLTVMTTLDMLSVCAALLLAGIGFAWLIAARGVPLAASVPSNNRQADPTSNEPILRNSYVALLFLVTLCRVICFVFVDFQMKMTAGTAYADSAELTGFFSDFYLYLGLVTMATQFLVSTVLLEKLGILTCLMLLPGVYLLMSGFFYSTGYGLFPDASLWIITTTNFLRLWFSESLDLPSRELLLLPLPPALRVKTQAITIGIIEPFSQGLGGLLVIGLSALGMRLFQYSGGIWLCAILWLVTLLLERPRYQRTLWASLHDAQLNAANVQEMFLTPQAEHLVPQLLDDPNPEIVRFTLTMLKGRSLKPFIPQLYVLTRQASPEIAAQVLELLGEDGTPIHLPLLEQGLEAPAPETRKAAILAVCRLQRHRAHEHLQHWLASPDPITREAAIIGAGRFAGQIGAGLIMPLLYQMAASAVPQERLQAAELLSAIGQTAYANLLPPLLADPEPTVRLAAIRACGVLQAYEEVPRLIRLLPETHLRPTILAALEQMPQESVPLMLSALYTPDFDETLRDTVFQILAAIDGPEAHEALWAFFVSHAPVITRVSAGHALQRLAQNGEGLAAKQDLASEIRVYCEYIRELNQACQEIEDVHQMLWRLLHDQAQLEIEGLFLLLSYHYGIAQIKQIHVNFLSSSGVRRANALELLDELLPRRIAVDVVRVLDDFSRSGSREIGRASSEGVGDLSAETIRRLCQREPWLRIVIAYFTNAPDVTLSAYEREILHHLPEILFLKNAPLFEEVPANYLVALARLAQRIHLPSGERLFAEGEPGNAMFLICHGVIQIMIGNQELARRSTGDCIGEMSLLDGIPRSATCVAAEDTELLMLRGADFERLLLNQTSVALALLRTLAPRLRQQTQAARQSRSMPTPQILPPSQPLRYSPTPGPVPEQSEPERLSLLLQNIVFLKRVPLFQGVPEQYLPALAALTRQVALHPGERLVREGDIGDALYILQRGSVSVQIGGQEINRIVAGDCLGEMSLLDQAPRSASCIACEEATLLQIAASDFDLVIRSQPGVLLALLRTIIGRLRHQTLSQTR